MAVLLPQLPLSTVRCDLCRAGERLMVRRVFLGEGDIKAEKAILVKVASML